TVDIGPSRKVILGDPARTNQTNPHHYRLLSIIWSIPSNHIGETPITIHQRLCAFRAFAQLPTDKEHLALLTIIEMTVGMTAEAAQLRGEEGNGDAWASQTIDELWRPGLLAVPAQGLQQAKRLV